MEARDRMKRTTSALLAGALAAGGTVLLSIALPGVASADSCDPTTVTNENLEGWVIPSYTRGGGTATFDADYQLVLDAPAGNGKVTIAYPLGAGNEIPLAEQTAQSNYGYEFQRFDGKPVGSPGAGDVTYEMEIDFNGLDVDGGYAVLVFEPYYQPANPGTWWSTRDIPGLNNGGGHGSNTGDWGTLDQISQAAPNAVIKSFGVNLNNKVDGTAAKGSVDSVTFGCNTFTFELANRAPVARIVVDDNTDSDYRTFWVSGTTSSDPDGDPLTYSWVVNGGTPSTSTASEYKVTFPNGPGTYQVQLTVSDGEKTSTTTESITVTPPTNTVQEDWLPNTGAGVIGLAAFAGLALVGGGAGTVLSRRRKADQTA